MSVDSVHLLRAVRHQSFTRGKESKTVRDAFQWGHLNGAATALLELNLLETEIPHHVAARFGRQSLLIGGLSDLAKYLHQISGEGSVLGLVREAWVQDEYGSSGWEHLAFLIPDEKTALPYCESCQTKTLPDSNNKGACAVCQTPLQELKAAPKRKEK